MKLVRQLIALVLLLVFAASNTALLPTVLTAVTWLDHDHAVSLVASGDRLEVVLSHHGEEKLTAEPSASLHPEHRHSWTTEMLVSLSDAPDSGKGDHVIPLLLGGQVATERVFSNLPSASPISALSLPTTQLVTLTTLPAISPVAAARPPPVSQLLLSLRTTVLVV